MSDILPQQRLVLELLSMTGNFAVPVTDETTVLWRTLHECKVNGFVRVTEISSGVYKVQLTLSGRRIVREVTV